MVAKAKNTGAATLVFLRIALEISDTKPAQNSTLLPQVALKTHVVEQGQVLAFVVEFSLTRPVSGLEYSIEIHELGGRLAFATNSTELGSPLGALQPGTHVVRCLVAAVLPEGEYTTSFAFAEIVDSAVGAVHLAALDDAYSFQVQQPSKRQAKGYAALPSSLLHHQKSMDVVLASPPVLQTAAGDREDDEWVWEMNSPHLDIELEGFSNFESWGIWSIANTAILKISRKLINYSDNKVIFLLIKPPPFLGGFESASIYVGSNEKKLKKYFFKKNTYGSHKRYIKIPIFLDEYGNIKITIKSTDLFCPSDFGVNSDSRTLGFGIEKIIISSKDKKHDELKSIDLPFIKNNSIGDRENLVDSFAIDDILSSGDILSDSLSEYIINNINSIDLLKFKNLFEAVLILKGFSLSERNRYISIAEKIISNDYLNIELCNSNCSKESGGIICVAGFFYSGSSAVFDWLKGSEKNSTIASLDLDLELPLVGDTYNILSSYERIDILKYFFQSLLNLFIPKNEHDVNKKNKDYSILELSKQYKGKIDSVKYSYLVFDYLSHFIKSDLNRRRFLFSSFLKKCAEIEESSENSFLLLNQAPTAMGVMAINALPEGTKLVAVHRDPRDQFISLRTHFGVEEFINQIKSDRSKFDIQINDLKGRYCFILVSFEEFVTNKNCRDNLCLELGLEPGFKSKFFNPDISKKRIGKYKNITDPYLKKQILIIEKELSEYLWHGEVN